MSDLTDKIEQLAAYEAAVNSNAEAELREVVEQVRRLEEKREPREMMTPRQHYAAATKLITEGLNKLDRVTQGVSDIGASWQARSELIALAHVHATLATVPQPQFDAWKAEVEGGQQRATFIHRRPGSNFSEPAHHGLIAYCGSPTCMNYVAAVREQHDSGVIDLPSAAAGGRGVHQSPDGRSHVGRVEDCGNVLCVTSQAARP